MLGIPLGNLTHLDGFCSSKDGFPRWHSSNESTYQCRRHKRHRSVWILKIPCRRKWQPSPVFLLGKSHRQTSLVTKSRKQLSNWEHCLPYSKYKIGMFWALNNWESIYLDWYWANFVADVIFFCRNKYALWWLELSAVLPSRILY